jgi:glycosyltransferase involved in cell wall biosynthesis
MKSRGTGLVSIIIPCYNAERWVAEAIQSCLEQTYRPIELIVIDDGSTDNSLDVIKSFGDAIQWETGPNRGGNHARNRGFELSRGEYIQFLDADDYLLPEKIETQVACLQSNEADVVYGDWRHLCHLPEGRAEFEEVTVSGGHADMLQALLGGWWVASHAVLLRRQAVSRIGGWDESLKAAQDTDLMIRLALAESHFVYQPGCHSIYRRYGNVTVGTGNRLRSLDNHSRVLDKAIAALDAKKDMKHKYRRNLAQSFFRLAHTYFDLDRTKYESTMEKALSLDPEFSPSASPVYRTVQWLLGFRTADLLASWKRRFFAR